MLIFDNLKSFLRNSFNFRKKDNNTKSNKNCEADESNISLLEDQERSGSFKLNHGNVSSVISNSTIFLSIIPTIYLLTSVLTIIILLVLKNKKNNRENLHKIDLPNYFELSKINAVVFHIYTCITSICGTSIVFILFSILKQRFKVPEYRQHSFKLYIMMLFGVVSNSLNLLFGFRPYIENNYKLLYKEIEQGIKVEVSQLIFLSFIFFSILFSIYLVTILNLLGNKQNSGSIISVQEDNWFRYKIVILCYLSFFTIIYILFVIYENKMLVLCSSLNSLIEQNLNFVLKMFPYFIHILNAILIFSFYFEMKFINLTMSQNLDVDYLFEKSEKNIF